MKRLTNTLVLIAIAVTSTGVAQAQFVPGGVALRPEFGFGIDSSFGVVFGGAMTYAFSENMAVGPVFAFSTAGRKFELTSDVDSATGKAIVFGGRFYYMFNPEHDYPWYIDAGIGIVKYGSINETDEGQKFAINNEEAEIEGATRFGFNFGGGTMYGINDNMTLVIDANSYIGGHGEPVVKAGNNEIKLQDVGSFWLLTFTVGLNFAL